MSAITFHIITGTWPDDKLDVRSFLDVVFKNAYSSENTYQLRQTFSVCELEKFEGSFVPDVAELEQYRAFCDSWELWIRNINARALHFRFITNYQLRDGWELRLSERIRFTHQSREFTVRNVSFPLKGKPLIGQKDVNDNELKGWYTAEIPRLINYPLEPEKGKQVELKVKELLNSDGYVELMSYSGLEKVSLGAV